MILYLHVQVYRGNTPLRDASDVNHAVERAMRIGNKVRALGIQMPHAVHDELVFVFTFRQINRRPEDIVLGVVLERMRGRVPIVKGAGDIDLAVVLGSDLKLDRPSLLMRHQTHQPVDLTRFLIRLLGLNARDDWFLGLNALGFRF